MTSKYRLCMSRCSLAVCNLNLFAVRPSSQFYSIRGVSCCNVRRNKDSLLRKDSCRTDYSQHSANISTTPARQSMHSVLSRESTPVVDTKHTVINSTELLSILRTRNSVNGAPRRGMAGHAHWQNIKHIKGVKDKEKSDTALKVKKLIVKAIKEGGSADPKTNRHLAKAMETGINLRVPKARVQDMVALACKKDKEFQTHYFYGLGPQGCNFVCEVFTDSFQRSRNEIISCFKKCGGSIHNETVRQSFDEKGVIEVPVTEDMEPVNMDKYLEIAIEVGAEDVILVEDPTADNESMKKVLKFHCGPLQVKNVSKEIEAHDLEVTSAESEFIPLHWVPLQEPELSTAQKIYEKLSEHEDVTKVFDNVTVPEE